MGEFSVDIPLTEGVCGQTAEIPLYRRNIAFKPFWIERRYVLWDGSQRSQERPMPSGARLHRSTVVGK